MVWSRYANGWKQITTQSSPLLHPRKQKQRTANQRFWPEIEVDGEGLSKPHRQYKLMEEKRDREICFTNMHEYRLGTLSRASWASSVFCRWSSRI